MTSAYNFLEKVCGTINHERVPSIHRSERTAPRRTEPNVKPSARLADALRTLAREEQLTPAQRQELEESGWGDASAKDAQRELEEQARRMVAR